MTGSALFAQSVYEIRPLNGPVTFDGKPDEPAWTDIPPVPVQTLMPEVGHPPTEKTEIRIAHDREYLYLGARLFVSSPDKISRNSRKRDEMTGNSDYVGIVIDSFNDNENALAFFTNPEGLRLDAAVFNDAQSPDPNTLPINMDWNTFWDALATSDDSGWYAEIRIPFTSLRYQRDENGEIIMGIMTWRWLASDFELDIYPPTPLTYGFLGSWKPSLMQKVVIRDIDQKKPLYVTPYGLVGLEHTNEINADHSAYHGVDHGVYQAGVDVKYGVSNNLTLDFTVNTDFAQVEVDAQQVNLTRFSLFFPEKRQFFLERSSVFEFNLGGQNRLFYSRKIGINEDGELVRIYGGVRAIGRAGPWDIGFMDMQTESFDGEPSTNWGVLRIRKKVSKTNSYLGAMVTSKINHKGYNFGYGLDGIINITGSNYLSVAWTQTFDNDSLYQSPLDNSKFRINLEKRKIDGFGYNLSLSRVGAKYNPEMGFELRQGAYRFGNSIWLGWLPSENSSLMRHQVLLEGELWKFNDTNATQSLRLGPAYTFGFKNGWEGKIGISTYYENITESFGFSDDAEIPAGTYDFFATEGYITTPGNLPAYMMTRFYYGTFYDGTRTTVTFMPFVNLSAFLGFNLTYSFNNLQFRDRDQEFVAHLVGFKPILMFSTKVTLSAYLQFNHAEDIFLSNIRFRYNPREGNDLYLVYNESFNSDRYREIPTLPVSDLRTITLKYTYTFQN